ncbi:MAG: MATE family efflux transporter [Candidatus Merdivicinus sp.]|jgi:putative MATE family efflux protein
MTGFMKALSGFFGAKDMTEGNPYSCLVQFAIPLLIGNLAQQLYNTVDSIVVGTYVGDNALAAVGASMPLFNLILVLFVGISTGASIMVAQYFGAKDREMLSDTVGNAIILTLIASIFMMIVGVLTAEWFMNLLDTPADIMADSCSYLKIIFLGIAGVAFYNILTGILRGLGDSLMPLIFLLIACGLNIVLDLAFVILFKWGVAGVAWATIISQAVSSILCLFRLFQMKSVLTINRHAFRLKGNLVKQLVWLGLPSGATQAIFSMAALIVQSLTNSFGTLVIASNVIVMRVDGFAMMPNFSFGIAMTTFVGQNIGAGKMDRVDQGNKDGLRLGLLVSVILVAAILLFGRSLMSLFTSTTEVIDFSMKMMQILAVGYIAMAVTQTLSGTMRGAGDTITPMWISMVTTVIIRMPLAYLIAFLTRSEENPVGNPACIFISLVISWIIGAVLTFFMYRLGKWKTKGFARRQNSAA